MATGGPVTLLYARLLGGKSESAQLWFDSAVLDKYRQAGARVMRTETMGRLKLSQWSVDFGIADARAAGSEPAAAGALIHVSLGEAQVRIPEAERGHWASHAAALPYSANYVTVQLTKGTCVDDGDLRDW